MEDTIAEIKQNIDIVNLAERLGVEVTPNRKNAKCFNKNGHKHGDKSPSLGFKGNMFKCFTCDVGGSVIDLYMGVMGVDLKTAIQALKEMYGIREHATPYKASVVEPVAVPPKQVVAGRIPTELDKEIYRTLHGLIEEPTGDILEYLTGKKRGLTVETVREFGIKYIVDANKVRKTLEEHYGMERLLEAGLYTKTERGNYFMFTHHAIIIPYFSNGEIVYLKGRAFGEAERKYTQLANTEIPLFNTDAIKEVDKLTEELYICEGEFDTIIATQEGYKAIGIIGVNGLKEQYIDTLKGLTVILAYDNDEAGERAIMKDSEALTARGVRVKGRVRLPEGIKDLTEYFTK